nr:hypothetical protein [Mycoplasmopsis bovis]
MILTKNKDSSKYLKYFLQIIANSFNDINKTAEMIIKSKQCQNALDSINDENNLINLPKQVHDWFDKNKFTYDQDGKYFFARQWIKNKWIVWIW